MTRFVTHCRLLSLAALFVVSSPFGCAHPDPQASELDALAKSFSVFRATLEELEAEIRSSPSYGTDAEQVGGYRHMLRALAKSMEAEILQDPDYPYFRILDFWLREGGDNPDQHYAFSPIRGGESYRIWGEMGSAVRVEFQIYAGKPWAGTGRSAGYLIFDELEIAGDGSFEVHVSAEQRGGNWMPNPEDSSTIFVRHIYDDWNQQRTGDVHIDRIGFEGRRRPQETSNELAQRIRAAAEMFGTTARTWPAFVARRYKDARRANSVASPYDVYALGGAKGRWMSGGYFELPPGKALLLRVPSTRAKYQAIQLTDMWFASLEHGNQTSSLTTLQSILSPDGAYYYVICPEDPGYANWLDSGVLRRGTFLMRWDGVMGELPEPQFPTAELVDREKLPELIPGFAAVTEAERDAVRRERRRHLQLRSHR
ncbi:MAG: hypothetical protein V3T64_10455 [Myxococcota bacterium]